MPGKFLRTLLVLVTITAASALSPAARALDPDTVMARHISALGGRGVVWSIDDFTITLEGIYMGFPATMTIRGMYPDCYEEVLTTEHFEIRAIHTTEGTRLVTADGQVIEPEGLDREALAARAAVFNYAYIRDMSIPLLPDSQDTPTGFTMDTGANFGTHIIFNPETYLIDGFSLCTGTENLTVFFSEYDTFEGVTFPGVIDVRGDTEMTLRTRSVLFNSGLQPSDFILPAESAPAPATTVRISLNATRKSPIIPVKAGNKSSDLLLDTTWETLPVIPNMAGPSGDVFSYRHDGETVFLRATPPVSLKLGDLSFDTPLLTTDGASPLFDALPDGADGVIGGMLLLLGPVMIDPGNSEVTLFDRESFSPPSFGKKTRLTVEGSTPLVAGTAGGVYGFWIIDTGFDGFGYLADAGPGEDLPQQEGDVFVGDINVGGVVLEGVTLTTRGYVSPTLPDVLGGLGVEFLESVPIVLDYREGVIYLITERKD
ncbi:MAG: hypothetical protein JW885_15900 [Deltaproteobacteria bacterium]|nr:hypothetical protein [Candidatus Zymogenaceae bacterium]